MKRSGLSDRTYGDGIAGQALHQVHGQPGRTGDAVRVAARRERQAPDRADRADDEPPVRDEARASPGTWWRTPALGQPRREGTRLPANAPSTSQSGRAASRDVHRHITRVDAGAAVLEAAAEHPVAFTARVHLDLGDAQAGQAGVPAGHRLGDEVLVQHRDDRQLEAGQPGQRGRPGPRRDDHLLGREGRPPRWRPSRPRRARPRCRSRRRWWPRDPEVPGRADVRGHQAVRLEVAAVGDHRAALTVGALSARGRAPAAARPSGTRPAGR